MSADPGVVIRYSLPDAEHDALQRIQLAIGEPLDLAAAAVIAYTDAGRPTLRDVPPCNLDPDGDCPDSLAVYRIVRWWLRRSPALEILAPAKLLQEAIAKEAVGDIAGVRAAVGQIGRIGADLEHPASAEARGLLLACVPEPQRSRMRDLEQAALEAIAMPPAKADA